MDTRHPFGIWLKARRRERDLSQVQLADAALIDRGYISRMENGRVSTPTHETRQKLHRALGTTDDDLVDAGLLRRSTLNGANGPIVIYETVPHRLEEGQSIEVLDPQAAEVLPPALRTSFLLTADLSPERQERLAEYINDLVAAQELERLKRNRGR